jgi:tRNA dimethylallyltransferase
MIAEGLEGEVRQLLERGYRESLKPMQSLGYRHMVSFLAGRQSLDQVLAAIQSDTRRYARRQMTWFAADREIHWLDPRDAAAACRLIADFLHLPSS